MKKLVFLCLLALALCLAVSSAWADTLVGCTTHAAYQDSDGVWRLYGCQDHGETALDGRDDILQIETDLHLTVALHTDGTVSVHGATDLPLQTIAGWRNVREIALVKDQLLIARKADGTILLAHCLPLDRYEKEYANEILSSLAEVASLTNVERLIASEDAVGFLRSGNMASVMNNGDCALTSFVNWWRTDWDSYQKIEVHAGQLLLQTKNGELYQLTQDRHVLLRENVEDFTSSFDSVYALGTDHTLARRTVNLNMLTDETWRDGLTKANPHRIDSLVGASGYFICVMKNSALVAEGTNGESDFFAEVEPLLQRDYTVDESWIAQAVVYKQYLLVRHDNGTINAVLADGNLMDYATFNPSTLEEDREAFLSMDGPVQQVAYRQRAGRFSYPYAVKSDGAIQLVNPDAHALPQALSWTDVAGISATQARDGVARGSGKECPDAWMAAAVTRDGRVLTAYDGNNPDTISACAQASQWTDVKQIACYGTCIAAVTRDGRVLVAGTPDNTPRWQDWEDIAQVAFSSSGHTGPWMGTFLYGLKTDGTVVGGMLGESGIVALRGGNQFILGVKADHTVVGHGYNFLQDCCVHHYRGVWDVPVVYEWGGWVPYIGVDGKIYQRYDLFVTLFNGFEHVSRAVAVFPSDGSTYYVLTEDEILYGSDGSRWDLR